jgi:hypothetical protein
MRIKDTVDTAAARVIQATARILEDLKVDEDRPELAILTLVRAAGWLIGFTPADADDKEHIEGMIEVHCKALRTAATDPLTGAEGDEFQRQALASLARRH